MERRDLSYVPSNAVAVPARILLGAAGRHVFLIADGTGQIAPQAVRLFHFALYIAYQPIQTGAGRCRGPYEVAPAPVFEILVRVFVERLVRIVVGRRRFVVRLGARWGGVVDGAAGRRISVERVHVDRGGVGVGVSVGRGRVAALTAGEARAAAAGEYLQTGKWKFIEPVEVEGEKGELASRRV